MENQKTSIVSALEVLESIKFSFKNDENDDKNNHLRHISALTNIKETETNLKSSINENTIDYNNYVKDNNEIPNVTIKSKEKELVKSYSNNKEINPDKNLSLEKKNLSNNQPEISQKQQEILKSNSSKINFEKAKQNIIPKNIITNNIKNDVEVPGNNNINYVKTPNKPNNNNLVSNIISPKNKKIIQFPNNSKPNQVSNMINNEKLNKNKETLTFEEKKMVEKKNYESNKIEKNIKSSDFKPIQISNIINNNLSTSLNDKNNINNEFRNKPKSSQTIINQNQIINKSSGFNNLNMHKVK